MAAVGELFEVRLAARILVGLEILPVERGGNDVVLLAGDEEQGRMGFLKSIPPRSRVPRCRTQRPSPRCC